MLTPEKITEVRDRTCDNSVLPTRRLKVHPHGQKFSRTTWYNEVVRHKTCCGRGSVDGMGDVSCDQDREPPNVGPLQKEFVRHNGLTKMLCVI